DHAEVGERLLAPAEEAVALLVPGELHLDVALKGGRAPERVDLHRVVNDQVDRLQRVDPLRVAAELLDGLAHGRQVNDDGDTGEVLEEDARRGERNLVLLAGVWAPVGNGVDVASGHAAA